MVKPTLTQRAQGTVRSFDLSKGYGYIAVEGRDDVFVHYLNIEGKGLRALTQGEQVSFLIEESEIGPQALHVIRSQ
jgi:CspA family cold shock protein